MGAASRCVAYFVMTNSSDDQPEDDAVHGYGITLLPLEPVFTPNMREEGTLLGRKLNIDSIKDDFGICKRLS